MIYKFKGLEINTLGFSCIHLPTDDGTRNGVIIEAEAAELIDAAYEKGVNYFDLAYDFHGGKAEEVVGKILSKYPRESYFLADKFPGGDLANFERFEEIFEEQLARTGAGYFDFYMLENVCEENFGGYVDPRVGFMDFMIKQKGLGRIKHLGFTSYAGVQVISAFLEYYGKEMEFGQLVMNYIDWMHGGSNHKAFLLNSNRIPIWIMKPLKGGKLAGLEDQYHQILQSMRPGKSDASWAYTFVRSIEGIGPILCGISNMAQLDETLEILDNIEPFDMQEYTTLLKIGDKIVETATCD